MAKRIAEGAAISGPGGTVGDIVAKQIRETILADLACMMNDISIVTATGEALDDIHRMVMPLRYRGPKCRWCHADDYRRHAGRCPRCGDHKDRGRTQATLGAWWWRTFDGDWTIVPHVYNAAYYAIDLMLVLD